MINKNIEGDTKRFCNIVSLLIGLKWLLLVIINVVKDLKIAQSYQIPIFFPSSLKGGTVNIQLCK